VRDISIIICTRNRAASLAQTLASLGDVRIPPGRSSEIIVVDNGSSDETADVVRQARVRNAQVKYILEARPGQARARNRGIAEAAGDVIVFTDDDVTPARDWVERITAPILSGSADAVAGCVRIAPNLERPWMTEMHRSWVADTGTLDPANPGRMVGANMAFSRSILDRVPAFDEDLGPGAIGYGDDTLFSQQLKAAGCRLAAAFDAIVEHQFSEERLSAESWVRSAKALGQVDAYISHHWDHAVWPHPRWSLGTAFLQLLHKNLMALIQRSQSPAPESLLTAIRNFHAQLFYLGERRKPRYYALHGLVKLPQVKTS